MTFSSENVKSVNLVIDADPAGTDEIFYMFRAPRAITVVDSYGIIEVGDGAGTAISMALENWGTGGTAIKTTGGTVVATMGGTAVADRLATRTPNQGVPIAANDEIAEGEWLVMRYAEPTVGWQTGQRAQFVFEYVEGVGA